MVGLLLQELRKTSKPMAHKPFVSAASITSKTFTPDTQVYQAERPQTTGMVRHSLQAETPHSIQCCGQRVIQL